MEEDQHSDRPFLQGRLALLHDSKLYWEQLLVKGQDAFRGIIATDRTSSPMLDLDMPDRDDSASRNDADELEQSEFPFGDEEEP